MDHRVAFVVREAWRGLRRNAVSASAAVVALVVGLVLLGGALLIDAQVRQVSGFWFDDAELSIFLCQDDCSPGAQQVRRDLEADLEGDRRVSAVTFDHQQAAYHRLIESFEGQPNPLVAVSREELPTSLRVDLHPDVDAGAVADSYRQRPGVHAVVNRDDALAFPQTLLGGLRTGALVWAVVQLAAVVVLVANTVTQSVYVRLEQLTIMRSVGASRWQIDLPLVLEGWMVATLGWAGAWIPLLVFWPDLSRAIVGDSGSLPTVGTAQVITLGPALLVLGLAVTTITALVAARAALRSTA